MKIILTDQDYEQIKDLAHGKFVNRAPGENSSIFVTKCVVSALLEVASARGWVIENGELRSQNKGNEG